MLSLIFCLAFSFALVGATYTSLLVPAGAPSGMNHFLSDMYLACALFVGIDDHVIPRLHFGPDGLNMTFCFDLTAPLARVWLWCMVLFGIGAHIVPSRAPLFDIPLFVSDPRE